MIPRIAVDYSIAEEYGQRLDGPHQQLLLRKLALIETVYDRLKNLCQIEHTRHRSPVNFLVNLLGGMIFYSLLPHKPSLY